MRLYQIPADCCAMRSRSTQKWQPFSVHWTIWVPICCRNPITLPALWSKGVPIYKTWLWNGISELHFLLVCGMPLQQDLPLKASCRCIYDTCRQYWQSFGSFQVTLLTLDMNAQEWCSSRIVIGFVDEEWIASQLWIGGIPYCRRKQF